MPSLSDEITHLLERARTGLGKPYEAIEFCEQVLSHPKDVIGNHAFCEAHYLLGLSHRLIGKLNEAEADLLYAKQLAEAIGSEELLASSTMQLGLLYMEIHQFDEANSMLGFAAENYLLQGDTEKEARALLSLANAYWMQRREPEAKQTMEEALMKFTDAGSNEGVTAVFCALANIDIDLGKYKEAKERLDLCSKMLLTRSHEKNWIFINLMQADCEYHLGRKDRAKKMLRSVTSRAAKLGYHFLECKGALLQAHHLTLEGDTEHAMLLMQHALDLATANGFVAGYHGLTKELNIS